MVAIGEIGAMVQGSQGGHSSASDELLQLGGMLHLLLSGLGCHYAGEKRGAGHPGWR